RNNPEDEDVTIFGLGKRDRVLYWYWISGMGFGGEATNKFKEPRLEIK
ncbi:MAG: hypothetical protein GXN99_02650, partial [Candidatus Nanohaloarchaeota archaeon]|nr:hypothetical protein [Candidatus Nanohaloarchaeota archaeon]